MKSMQMEMCMKENLWMGKQMERELIIGNPQVKATQGSGFEVQDMVKEFGKIKKEISMMVHG